MRNDHSPDHRTAGRVPGWYTVAVPGLLTILAAVVVAAGG